MISVPVRDVSGKEVGSYQFDPNELAPGVNKQLLHDVVVMYETNCRVGTVQTKTRGEVEGSTRKLYRQKGTGRARVGTVRSPIRRGGGHAHARRPRDWSYRLPKRAIRLATRMALLSKFLDEQVVVLDSIAIGAPKTKAIANLLKAVGYRDESCLLAIEKEDANIWKSARNMPNVWVSPADGLNAYNLLHQKRLVVTKAALDQLRQGSKKNGEKSADR